MIFSEKMAKALANPMAAGSLLVSLLRGKLLAARLRLRTPRVQIGRRFRALSALHIIGPGQVIIGDDVSVALNFLRVPSIVTHLPESCVIIGDGTFLGGTRISCVNRVTIGRKGLLGCATLIDSDVIPSAYTTLDARWQATYVKAVRVGDYFWAGTNSCIVKGAVLGDECVLGAGGMVYDQQFPDRSLLVGNPARRIGATRC